MAREQGELVAEFVAPVRSGPAYVVAVPSGPGSEVSIDLDAVNAYYQQLWQLHDEVTAAYDRIAATLGQARHRPAGSVHISGVDQALRVSRRLAHEGNHGLLHSLRMVQSMIERNLADLHDSYQAYLSADTTAADELDQAMAAMGDAPL